MIELAVCKDTEMKMLSAITIPPQKGVASNECDSQNKPTKQINYPKYLIIKASCSMPQGILSEYCHNITLPPPPPARHTHTHTHTHTQACTHPDMIKGSFQLN